MKSRTGPRLQAILKVVSKIDKNSKQKFILLNGDSFEANTYDISASGMGVYTKYFFPKGLILELEIKGEPLGMKEHIRAKGEVRHCEFIKTHYYRCGLRFTDIQEKDKNAIAEFIAANDRRKDSRLSF